VSVRQNEPGGSCQHTIFIASDDVLAAWSACASAANEVLAVAQHDLVAALDIIRRRRPAIVVLEEAFAGSSRGAALVTRLQTDPGFRGVEVRLLTAERVAALQSTHAVHPHTQVSLAALARPVLLRRTGRVRPASPVEILINGNPATLVNLSTSGTQVCSCVALRPQQGVRVSFPLAGGAMKMSGVVVWSVFEIDPTPTYRAGIMLAAAFPLPTEEILSRLASSQALH